MIQRTYTKELMVSAHKHERTLNISASLDNLSRDPTDASVSRQQGREAQASPRILSLAGLRGRGQQAVLQRAVPRSVTVTAGATVTLRQK